MMSPEQQQELFDRARAEIGLPPEPLVIITAFPPPGDVMEQIESSLKKEFRRLHEYRERLTRILAHVDRRMSAIEEYVLGLDQVIIARQKVSRTRAARAARLPHVPDLPDDEDEVPE